MTATRAGPPSCSRPMSVAGKANSNAAAPLASVRSSSVSKRLRCHVGRLERDGHGAVGDGLAEDVVGLDSALDGLARLVVRLIEREGDLEPRQDVSPDLDRRPAGRLADAAIDLVVPLDQLAGQRTIGRADPEPAGRFAVAEDDVAARVGQGEGHHLAGDRLEVGPPQRQAAHVDDLSRLVDRLVGAGHQPPGVLERDGPRDRLGS